MSRSRKKSPTYGFSKSGTKKYYKRLFIITSFRRDKSYLTNEDYIPGEDLADSDYSSRTEVKCYGPKNVTMKQFIEIRTKESIERNEMWGIKYGWTREYIDEINQQDIKRVKTNARRLWFK